MPHNFLLTGAPGSGKTTVVEEMITNLKEHGFTAGGVYCPEIRSDGERQGFEIVDIMTDESVVLAHVEQESGPSVGKYRVNVANVDAVCGEAFPRTFDEADYLVVDEIAPMEVHSDVFKEQMQRALDADMPLVAVIHQRSTSGFIGEVKQREDTELFEVTNETRDELPETLTEFVLAELTEDDWLLESIQEEILEIVEEEDFDREITSEDVSEITGEIIEDLGMNIYEQVISDERGLRRYYETRAEFERGIEGRWGEPLELLERFIVWSLETGRAINTEYRPEAAQEQDFVFDALTRLHARAVQVAMEIHHLLKAGFADGAFARWRSLHELSITTSFILEANQDTAEQFLLYRHVWEYDFAQTYQEHADDLDVEEIDPEMMRSLEETKEELIDRFGSKFDGTYGTEWAADELGLGGGPTITRLAEEAGLDHYHPYYRLASESLHGGSKGTLDRLGIIDIPDVEQPEILLSGPSNAGLAMPGQLTAISLSQITFALIRWQSSSIRIAEMQGMQQLVDDINHAFAEASEELYEDERDVMQEWADQDIVDIALNYIGAPALFVDEFFSDHTEFDSPAEFEEAMPIYINDIANLEDLPPEVNESVDAHSEFSTIEELIEAAFESWVRREVDLSEVDVD